MSPKQMAEPAPRIVSLNPTLDENDKGAVKITISLSPEFLKVLEDYRFAHRCKSMSAAIRELAEKGLSVAEPKVRRLT